MLICLPHLSDVALYLGSQSHFSTFIYFRFLLSPYWYGHVEACGSGLLRHWLNFSTAWCNMRLISVKKCQKRLEAYVLMQRSNTYCDRYCLPDIATHHNRFFSKLSTITPTHNWLFGASNVWKNATNLQSDEKVLHSQVRVVTFSGKVGKWITACFRLR